MVDVGPWLSRMNMIYRPGATVGTFFYIDGLEPILDKIKNDAYILLNISNVADKPVDVPPNKKLYIFSWAVDPFEFDWFLTVYNKNPHSHFIVLCEGRAGELANLERVTHIGLCFAKGWIQAVKHHGKRPYSPLADRKLKISCHASMNLNGMSLPSY